MQKTWGGSQNDQAKGITIDPSGNILITGLTNSFGAGEYDVFLTKYSPAGDLLWQRIWGGTGHNQALGAFADSDGSIYVTGGTSSFGTSTDAFLIKFNAMGNLQWQRTWGGAGAQLGWSVALDNSGNVYVTGHTESFGSGHYDVFLLKFDPSGSLQWQRIWGGKGYDVGYSVGVGSSGNVYVAGSTSSFGAGGSDAFLLKFDPSGNLLWQRTWGGSYADSAYALTIDSNENIYVTGQTSSYGYGAHCQLEFGPCSNVFLLKFSASGTLLAQRTWGGPGNRIVGDLGYGAAVDRTGSVYVTGETNSFSVRGSSVFLLKFDSSANLTWELTWGRPLADRFSYDQGRGVAVAGDKVFVTGFVGESPPYELRLLTIDATTNPTATANATVAQPFTSTAIPASPPGIVSTPSGTENYGGGTDAFLLELAPPRFSVLFNTSPAVGSIDFSGKTYTDGKTDNYTVGNYTVTANTPAGFLFTGWSSKGNITITGITSNPTTVGVTGAGTLTATFTLLPTILIGVVGVTVAAYLIINRRKAH